MGKFKALLLDIEGTITSISFVKDELFPYAYKNVANYLDDNFDNPDVHRCIAEMMTASVEEAMSDEKVKVIRSEIKEETISDVVENVRYWIDIDKKITSMKTLQGLIWEYAYKSGAVKGHLYPDVVSNLRKVHETNRPIYIYSSGSVYAQKLLFQNSIEGDITELLSGYFDTHIGLKGDSESYRKIAHQIRQAPADILFLTDIEAEARAAHNAGFAVHLVVRPGNGLLSEEARKVFTVIQSLDELLED
ncbi:unnamed protein product, partial [Mesorhabditis belari]|uniref:Enolase-phosphatase E1 n=1 Tax=Mesorhabditis belari TaxID=2138241 RepID=A0AAF3J419_9BILA